MKKRKDKTILVVSLIFLVAMLLFFLIAPNFLPHDPHETDLSQMLLSPGEEGHLLGTDQLGRCIACRLIEGGRETIYTSLVVVLVVSVFGSILGMVSGFKGGVVDAVITKITTVFQAFPSFVLAVAIAGILGAGKGNGMVSLMLVSWTTYVRYSRSLVQGLSNETYIRAAKMCHASDFAIIIKYIIPNIIPPLILTAALDIGNVVLSMAGLSYIGLGATRPTAEWGLMMSEARSYLASDPLLILLPGFSLLIVVFMFNYCGDSYRKYLDKKGGVKI